MSQLAADPEYQLKARADEANRQVRMQQLRRAEQPIVKELRAAGYEVNSVWDLANTSGPYPNALPVLLKHLQLGGYPDRVMEGLARALAVKPSVEIWGTLRQLYLTAQGPGEEEGLAAALAASATADQLDALIALLGEVSRGRTRIHFLRPIKRVGGKRGLDVLKSLQDDPLFGKEAGALLKRRVR
ncbi:MAG: hypothetical protein ABIO06_09250 [Pseudolysinimonas sp.]